MFRHNSFYGTDEIFWFENGESGIALVRPSGSKLWESQMHLGQAPDFCKCSDAIDGWKRAILFIEEFGIWDITAFACSMNTALCYPGADHEALLFVAPQNLDLIPAAVLPPSKRKLVSENLSAFYSDPNLQAKVPELVLHGMAFCFDGSALEPISMKKALDRVSRSEERAVFPVSYLSSAKKLKKQLSTYCGVRFSQTDCKEGALYHITRAGYEAFGKNCAGKFMILKGSIINPNITGVMPKAAVDAREACIENGILDDRFKLKEDITLSSSSAAASFVVGHTVSGPMTWRDENGTTMKESL